MSRRCPRAPWTAACPVTSCPGPRRTRRTPRRGHRRRSPSHPRPRPRHRPHPRRPRRSPAHPSRRSGRRPRGRRPDRARPPAPAAHRTPRHGAVADASASPGPPARTPAMNSATVPRSTAAGCALERGWRDPACYRQAGRGRSGSLVPAVGRAAAQPGRIRPAQEGLSRFGQPLQRTCLRRLRRPRQPFPSTVHSRQHHLHARQRSLGT